MAGTELKTDDRAERDRWLTIELRHLAALAAVARQGSFTEAADRLGYVQSAVSQQVATLERLVGHRLVERSARPRSVELTDAGRTLLEHVGQILEQLTLAKAEVDRLTGEPPGLATFGVDALFGPWLHGALLRELLSETDGDGWQRVACGSAEQLLEQVAGGELDAAFVPLPIAAGPFFALELTRQPYLLAAPRDDTSRLNGVDEILERWQLVQIDGCPATRALLDASPPARGPHVTSSRASALALVRSRVAAAVITTLDVSADDPAVVTAPLRSLPDCVIGMAWRRDRDGTPRLLALTRAASRAFA
ncbi:MAG: LysR family transcriptional regulator [Gemmatimonadales bacterium]